MRVTSGDYLDNTELNRSFLRIAKRAEKEQPEVLRRTFVPITPLMDALELPEHHILYGRRGTGKTHILIYLTETMRSRGHLAVYVDLQRIGSSGGLYGDTSESLAVRATQLLVDVISELHTSIYNAVLSDDELLSAVEPVTNALDAIGASATQVRISGPVEQELTVALSTTARRQQSAGIEVGPRPSISASAGSDAGESRSVGAREMQRGDRQAYLRFGDLSKALQQLLDAVAPRQLWLLLDEWASLPLDLQPLLADLLRRACFPVRGVTVKIGAIERRSRFMTEHEAGDYLGIDLGADTAASLDLDDFLVFQNGRKDVYEFFASVLHRHVQTLLEVGEKRSSLDPAALIERGFDTPRAFEQLVLASEGVPRDAIQILGLAAPAAGPDKIKTSLVHAATRNFFLRDKEGKIPDDAQRVLDAFIDRCAQGGSRLLWLRRHGESDDPVVQRLYDARLIHRIKQGVSMQDARFSERFDVYLVDFGCFVDLIASGKLRTVDDGVARTTRVVSASTEARATSFADLPARWYALGR